MGVGGNEEFAVSTSFSPASPSSWQELDLLLVFPLTTVISRLVAEEEQQVVEMVEALYEMADPLVLFPGSPSCSILYLVHDDEVYIAGQ